MHLIATHSMDLPAGKDAPKLVHLLPAGTFRGADGRGPYHVTDPAAFIAASMEAVRLPVDENHATDHAMTTGQPSPAQGWITALQAKPDGIWGTVEWTGAGRGKVADRAYRGISPVYEHTPDGQVLRLLRAGLTNTPNFTLTSLHSRQDTPMDPKKIREALGLPADATDAAVLDAIAAQRTAVSAHATALGQIAEAAGAAKDARPDAILTALQSRVAGVATETAQTITALQSQVTTLSNSIARTAAVAALDAAATAGKFIVPALREHYIARHMADPAGVQKELDGMPSLAAGGFVPPAAGATAGGETPTPEEVRIAAMMSIDVKEVVKTRNLRLATGQQGAD